MFGFVVPNRWSGPNVQLVGFVPYPIIWEHLLSNAFAEKVSGLDIVLAAGDQTYTYKVVEGQPVAVYV